jgi:hypothetical protein
LHRPENRHYPFLQSEAALDGFVRRWRQGKLPGTEWTHAAHVAVAAYHAFDHHGEVLFEEVKSGIIHHNNSVGTPNTDERGYHETLTRFWVQITEEFVRSRSFLTRLQAVKCAVHAFGEDRDRHKLYYSFDVVKDKCARREWVPPDRKPSAAR